jgi:short-subunit dehydrogenase
MATANRLQDVVVVITGASSGLGRATALELSREGARLVLAARREDDLDETARLCREAGGQARVIPTDVTDEVEVKRLAEAALAAWCRIDVWINNAGVTLFARLEEASFEEHRRVIETNLFGAILAARAVVPIFKQQREGVLINVGSVLSQVGQPFVPSYVISKFALRGMSEALRTELAELPDVHVCTIFPYAIDTPHFQAGANKIGKQARAMPPFQAPEKVARAIVALIRRPRREVHVPHIAVLGLALHWLLPRTTERLLLRALSRWHFDENRQRETEGNLYQPIEQGRGEVHGKRPPQLSTPRFIAWTLGELVRMEVESATRALFSLSVMVRTRLARAVETDGT